MQHPISKEDLERFAAGKATREENRRIVGHLLKGCDTCALSLQEIDRVETPMCAYDKALDGFERKLQGARPAKRSADRLLGAGLLSL